MYGNATYQELVRLESHLKRIECAVEGANRKRCTPIYSDRILSSASLLFPACRLELFSGLALREN
jgi:hypothetical protein